MTINKAISHQPSTLGKLFTGKASQFFSLKWIMILLVLAALAFAFFSAKKPTVESAFEYTKLNVDYEEIKTLCMVAKTQHGFRLQTNKNFR